MPNHALSYLEGKRLCLVLVRLEDEAQPDGPLKMKLVQGRASLAPNGALAVVNDEGSFTIPSSCYNRIMENDGTLMLEDAEYFVICRVAGMAL